MKSIRSILALGLLFLMAACSSSEQKNTTQDSTQKDTIQNDHNPAAATPSNGQF